jgi:type III restriction enzyme
VRAFGSQLLCEQIVGRGLRRRSYATSDDGLFAPDYAEVYGIPFALLPADRPTSDPPTTRPPTHVRTVAGRERSRIVFPRVDGYRFETPDASLILDIDAIRPFRLNLDDIASYTEVAGVVGATEEHDLNKLRALRHREIAVTLATKFLLHRFADGTGALKPWLVPQLVSIADQWLGHKVSLGPGAFPGLLMLGANPHRAAEEITRGIATTALRPDPIVHAIIRTDHPTGSTDDVDFYTTKATITTNERCHVSHVVLDSGTPGYAGNTWEQVAALELESLDGVAAYVKNDHLEFTIPYVFAGVGRRYRPDFLVRLVRRPGDVERHLIVEMSGGQKDQDEREVKAKTARDLWCAAVNADGRFGTWGYIEIDDPVKTKSALIDAIRSLYADEPITGVSGDPFEHENDDLLHWDLEGASP